MPPTRFATSVAISNRTWLRTSRRGVSDMVRGEVVVVVVVVVVEIKEEGEEELASYLKESRGKRKLLESFERCCFERCLYC